MATSTKDVLIAVMGMTGSGKSRFIQRVTGRKDVVVGHTLVSETDEVKSYSFHYEGYRFTLVDTIGFDDTFLSDDVILERLLDWLKRDADQDRKLSGIIYLHRILDPRIQGSAFRSMSMFRKLCGSDFYQNVVLGTTFWDSIDPALGARREDELMSDDNFWGRLAKKGSKCRRLGVDGIEGDRKLLLEIARNQKAFVGAQIEMNEGAAAGDTSAAKEVTQNMSDLSAAFVRQCEAERQRFEREIEKINQRGRRDLEAQKAAYEQKLRQREAEVQKYEQQKRAWEARQRARNAERAKEEQRLRHEEEDLQRRLNDLSIERLRPEPRRPCTRRPVKEVQCDRCGRRFKPRHEQFYHCCLCASQGHRDNYDQCTRCGPRCKDKNHGIMRIYSK